MDIFRAAERLMAMDDAAWARHAAPLSVYTRFTCLPLIVLAIWSRAWLGWWALVPLALALGWTWANPRAFAPPERTDGWASRGTFGERVYLNRHAVAIPRHHARAAALLTAGSALGLPPLVWGLWAFDPGWTICGLVLCIGAKTWFVDRMVWLYDDMKDADPVYRSWLRPG